jgi:uncharacterized protein (TIGR00290 family)
MKKVLFNWSGGKDSSLALYQILQEECYQVTGLLTSFNGANSRVSMHGIRKNLIEEQALEIGLKLHPLMLPEDIGMEEYDRFMQQALEKHIKRGTNTCIFGDIFLADLKNYREQQLQEVQMEAEFPLWQQSTECLSQQFIEVGFKAVVVSVNGSKLGRSFVGREYDAQFLADLPSNIDPCGEYGEFHTFVYDGPIFDHPVSFQKGEIVARTYEQQDDSHSFTDDNCQRREPTYFYLDLKGK